MDNIKFELDKATSKKAREWVEKHPCKIRGKYQGAIGGATTFSFTNTSIGQIQVVKCGCGKDLLLSDDL